MAFTDYIPRVLDAETLAKTRQFIEGHERFVVTAHKSPDGDAVGSALSLAIYLRSKGKTATVIMNDAPGDNLAFIPNYRAGVLVYDNQNDGSPSQKADCIKAIQECDAMIGVDFNQKSRMGDLEKEWMKPQVPRMLVDHHLDPEQEGFDVIISFPYMAAACEVVFRMIIELGDETLINKDIATTLFCGLMTDTGWFCFNCDRPEIHLIMARLTQEGVDRENIMKESHVFPERRLRLQSYAMLQKLVILREHRTAYFSLTKSEMKRFEHAKGDSEGLVNVPLDIEGIEVCIFLREEKNSIKLSLRSKGEYPVNLIASQFFNGGGHRNASGGEFYGTLESAEKLLVKVLPLFDKYLSKKDETK